MDENYPSTRKRCAYCQGDGKIGSIPCPACEGKGGLLVPEPVLLCSSCHGTGIAGCCRCDTCKGTGFSEVLPWTDPSS